MWISLLWPETRLTSSVPQPPLSQWHLLVITYISGNINVYNNGFDSKPYATKQNIPRNQAYGDNAIFHLGDSPVFPSAFGARMAMDEWMVRYSVITTEEIWASYVQGGRIW